MAGASTADVLTVADAFTAADLPFMIVGAWAVAVHGAPRFSKDIDVVVHVPFGESDRVRPVLDAILVTPLVERQDEWGHRLVGDLPSGAMVETFFTPHHPLYDREYERRVLIEWHGRKVPFLSAEDLVLRKLVNCRLRRGQDYDDAIGVIALQGDDLDRSYLRQHCGPHRTCALLERALEEAAAFQEDPHP